LLKLEILFIPALYASKWTNQGNTVVR